MQIPTSGKDKFYHQSTYYSAVTIERAKGDQLRYKYVQDSCLHLIRWIITQESAWWNLCYMSRQKPSSCLSVSTENQKLFKLVKKTTWLLYLASFGFHDVSFTLISVCMMVKKNKAIMHISPFFYGIQEWMKILGISLSVIITVINYHSKPRTFARICLLKHIKYRLTHLKHL